MFDVKTLLMFMLILWTLYGIEGAIGPAHEQIEIGVRAAVVLFIVATALGSVFHGIAGALREVQNFSTAMRFEKIATRVFLRPFAWMANASMSATMEVIRFRHAVKNGDDLDCVVHGCAFIFSCLIAVIVAVFWNAFIGLSCGLTVYIGVSIIALWKIWYDFKKRDRCPIVPSGKDS